MTLRPGSTPFRPSTGQPDPSTTVPETSAHRQETDMTETGTTERDQLAALLREHGTPIPDEGFPGDEYDCCADALLEAGVRPPARVISDPDELDDLPVGSVVREMKSLQRVWEINYVHVVGFERAGWWFTTGSKGSRLVQAIDLPVEVVHIPTQEGQADDRG